MSLNPFRLLYQPRQGWQSLGDRMPTSLAGALAFPVLMAALPAVAWYYGTAVTGWTAGGAERMRLTPDSAARITILFYLVMVAAVAVIGYAVHWMAQTYGAQTTTAKGIGLAGFTAVPLFVAGAVGFYPHFLVDLTVGLIAVSYATYLLYIGIPIVMKIPEERGFLFASAVIAVALVMVIAIMCASVILWDMGAAPVFTS